MRHFYADPALNGRPEKLHDEILAAFPEARTPPEVDATTRIEGDPAGVWITVPDVIPQADLDAVVAAHDPTTPAVRTLAARRTAKATFAAERQIASPP